MCPHIMTMQKEADTRGSRSDKNGEPTGRSVSGDYLDSALVTAGATAAENSPQTAPGASAPLSKPALATAPSDEDGPLLSEADPTSNAG